jgi:hypothetical protein
VAQQRQQPPKEAAKPAQPRAPARQEPVKAASPPAPAKPPAAEEDAFAALLKSVEQIDRRVEAPERREGRGSAATAGGGSAEIDALVASARRQMEDCWRLQAGLTGIERVPTFDVNVRFTPDGRAERVELPKGDELSRDPLARVVAESAQRAAWSCRLSLPRERYELWRSMTFVFDPKRAVTG